jgi:transposase-like protein
MKIPGTRRYSEAFKRQVVLEMERGKASISEIRRKYGINGALTLSGWLKRYGNGIRRGKSVLGKRRRIKRTEMRLFRLEQEKRELEQALLRVPTEKVLLESLLKEASEQLGVDIEKNFGMGR